MQSLNKVWQLPCVVLARLTPCEWVLRIIGRKKGELYVTWNVEILPGDRHDACVDTECGRFYVL